MSEASTLRLFVAVELTKDVLDSLSGAQRELQRRPDLARFRWVKPAGIHLTLKFLGETPASRQADIEQALERASAGIAPFVLRLGKLGRFGSRSAPRVVWVDCVGDLGSLGNLQAAVERELSALDYPPDTRTYSPHLTLARVPEESPREAGEALAQALASVPAPLGKIEVRKVSLMQSELRPGGAVYTRLFAITLR